jgi:hypothetical protein
MYVLHVSHESIVGTVLEKWLKLRLSCEMGIMLDRSDMSQNEVRATVLGSPIYSQYKI